MCAAHLRTEGHVDGGALARRKCQWKGNIHLKITVREDCASNDYTRSGVIGQSVSKGFAVTNCQRPKTEARILQRQSVVSMVLWPIVPAIQRIVAQTLRTYHPNQASQDKYPRRDSPTQPEFVHFLTSWPHLGSTAGGFRSSKSKIAARPRVRYWWESKSILKSFEHDCTGIGSA